MQPVADAPIVRRLAYRPPLDFDALIAFFAARAVPGVEEVACGRYRRSLRLAHGPGVVELEAGAGRVVAGFWLADGRDIAGAVQRVRALLDLDSDPEPIARTLSLDHVLEPLARRSPGRRVPGSADGDELAVRAVLGQQVSLSAAAALAGRLVAAYGEPLVRPLGNVTHVFPAAAALARADPARLAMPAARARALLALAAALTGGELVLDARADRHEARRRLLALPGIGPWTSEYVAMRALRDPDAFPVRDLGLRRALERLGYDGRPASAARIAERWRPYRAYALMHLWSLLADREPV